MSPVGPKDGLESPGLLLQRQREARGFSLDDVSRATKINKQVLHAIDVGDTLHLPAPVYTRGFVRAYADVVGLSPEATADEYLRRIAPAPAEPPERRPTHSTPSEVRRPAPVSVGRKRFLEPDQKQQLTRLALAAAAIGMLLYLASVAREDGPVTAAATVGSDQSDVVRAGGVTSAGLQNADVISAIATADGPLRVELMPRAPCWVSIRVGGETVLARLLQPGDRETIHLTGDAVMRVGEPGALSYSINGQSGRAFGPAGQPVTVRITKDNFRDFLSS